MNLFLHTTSETVVDAAMFGHGCTEGTVREAQQKELDRQRAEGYTQHS